MTDADGMVDGGDGWKMLIQRSWTVGSNIEDYFCRRITIAEDMHITGFRALSPPGTHHETLTITTATSPMGSFDCDPTVSLDMQTQMLFAGGTGTDDFLFPSGVAFKLAAGTTIQLYLHLYNASDSTTTQTSGVMVQTVPAAEVVNEADMMFVGKRTFQIPAAPMPPASPSPYTVVTDCGSTGNWHLVGMWPHMHKFGVHSKIEIERNNVIVKTPVDVPYDVDHQRNYSMDVLAQANDRIRLTCTWLNTTQSIVYSSDSSVDEMCRVGVYIWPKIGDLDACLNQ
jgi:hypothetical protein